MDRQEDCREMTDEDEEREEFEAGVNGVKA